MDHERGLNRGVDQTVIGICSSLDHGRLGISGRCDTLIRGLINQHMSEAFLTIKESAAKTGKAEITIRRFVQRIIKGTDAKRRAMIQPSPEELRQHVDGPPPAWRISTKLLDEQFTTTGQGSGPIAEATAPASPETAIVAVLKAQNVAIEKQLAVKDEQIKSLTTLVNSLGGQLNERLRESNVLMKGLQERMALPATTPVSVIDTPPAGRKPPSRPQKPKRDEPKKETDKSKQERRGWWGRLINRGNAPS